MDQDYPVEMTKSVGLASQVAPKQPVASVLQQQNSIIAELQMVTEDLLNKLAPITSREEPSENKEPGSDYPGNSDVTRAISEHNESLEGLRRKLVKIIRTVEV